MHFRWDKILVIKPGPEVIEILCSIQLSMKCFLLINVKKMPTFVAILRYMSRMDSILGLSDADKS